MLLIKLNRVELYLAGKLHDSHTNENYGIKVSDCKDIDLI